VDGALQQMPHVDAVLPPARRLRRSLGVVQRPTSSEDGLADARPRRADEPTLPTPTPPRVEVRQRLERSAVHEVLALIEAATVADGVRPLNEHVMLHLRHGGDVDARNVLVRDGEGHLAGYAHLDVTDTVAGPSAELVVHPMARGQGYGRALTETAAALAAEHSHRPLRLWSHGAHRSARELAYRMGFTHVRSLWQMRRSLYAPLAPATLPPGVLVRDFEPGRDESAWLDLNARAFAGHPEQGGWTRDDLERRMAEPWFDPAGFLLAVREDRLVGFHWTKVHGGHPEHGHDALGPHEHSGHGHDPIGEVYVLGVDPAERGTGVGRALTVLGLLRLRSRGLAQAMLYVDEGNTDAIALYESLGFTHWDTDVMYAHDQSPGSAARLSPPTLAGGATS
jgi:mycothiol synthase